MREACVKYEEWGNGFVALVAGLAFLWLVAGVWFTRLSGLAPAAVFVGLLLGMTVFAFYATCRYCYYYGKRCYLALGLVVPHFVKKVEEPAPDSHMILWAISLGVVLTYPLVFIFTQHDLAQAVLSSAVYLLAPITGIVLVGRYGCQHCKNTSCLSNPDRREQAKSQ